ncbi:MAG: hypothetical protein ACJASR_001211 [Psychroserpens sp.]
MLPYERTGELRNTVRSKSRCFEVYFNNLVILMSDEVTN